MTPGGRIAFHTFGCKLNFSESSELAKSFVEHGYARVELDDNPDVVVINTCSVTDHADHKCKRLIKRVKSANPNAFVAIIGCYAQLKPEEISSIDGVNLVLGANEKFNIREHIEQLEVTDKAVYNEPIKETKDFFPSFSQGDRTRTFLKVQDGCDYFCAFCTIPLARGRSRSNTIAETVAFANQLEGTDVREAVLTGVNIGDFGKANHEQLVDLIRELDTLHAVDRYRISSIEPNLLSDEIIDFVAQSDKFVPHFHIPLQSGSDFILSRMRRRYNTALYAKRIEQIKQLMPDACIGIDVIVGFPGETDEEFHKTVEFLKSLDFSYLHVFTYSERPNTTAVRMDEVIPSHVRMERRKILQQLSVKKKNAFYRSQRDRTVKVLWEHENREGMMYGFSENYLKFSRPFDQDRANQFEEVVVGEISIDCIASPV